MARPRARVRAAAVLLVAALVVSRVADAAPGPIGEAALGQSGAEVRAELMVDARRVEPGQTVRIGVRFDLDPGWHIYWKNSGDSGATTKLDWEAPGAQIGPIRWPAPRVFTEAEGALTTYGYGDDVLLASDAVVAEDAEGVWSLAVDAGFVACRTTCIPGRIQLASDVPVGATA